MCTTFHCPPSSTKTRVRRRRTRVVPLEATGVRPFLEGRSRGSASPGVGDSNAFARRVIVISQSGPGSFVEATGVRPVLEGRSRGSASPEVGDLDASRRRPIAISRSARRSSSVFFREKGRGNNDPIIPKREAADVRPALAVRSRASASLGVGDTDVSRRRVSAVFSHDQTMIPCRR